MDPTKSFDHLDPKLKETYARVMGTPTDGNGTPAQTTPTDPSLTSAPSPSTIAPNLDASPPSVDPNTMSSSPFNTTPSTLPTQTGPNPGTGPTISTLPTEPSLPASSWDPASTADPQPDTNSPATSSFFSNPSPATSDPSQSFNGNGMGAPIEPPTEPVTPYAPEEQLPQPLPSPSTVNQTAVKETSPLLKVLYIIGAVIFFAVYTIFWIKVFNLPFLF